jgi:photosystem II stability/assembly factor-like uncharacterized protein
MDQNRFAIPLLVTSLLMLGCASTSSSDRQAEAESPTERKLRPHLAEAFKWSYPDAHWNHREAAAALDNVRRWRRDEAAGMRMTGGEWRLEGPTNIGGRLNFLRATPGVSGDWWAGAAAGGVWHTSDFGASWTCVNDEMPHLAAGDIAFHPTSASTMFLATGDPQISSFPRLGGGVYRTDDGGETWVPDGLDTLGIVSRLMVSSVNGEPVLFAGTMGNPAIPGPARGLWRRWLDEGAEQWQQVLLPSDSAGVTDLVSADVPELGGTVLFASAWQRIRTSTTSVVTGGDCQIHRSLDGGATWEALPNPWGAGVRGRIGFAALGNLVWALVVGEDSQLDNIYRTADGGESWTAVIPEGGQPENALGGFGWYFSKIRVNPFNPDDLTILGVELHNSLDGGATWTLMNPDWWTYEVHADKHDLVWINANEAIIATDGGAYRTTNHGDTWEDIEDIPISQFYRVTWNPHDPGRYTGGAQDNGTTTGSHVALGDWTRDLGGDGFYPAFHPTDPALRYAEYQYGNMRFSMTSADQTPQWEGWMNGIADDARVWWDAPYMLHPANPDDAWCGRQQVYKMAGAPWGVWQPMSSDLTANVQPGLQWRAVTALAGSPADADVVAAGTSDGRVWWTANGGAFWQELTAGLPGQFITDLAFLHPDTLVCTVSGYRNAQYTPHIFKRPLFGGGDWTPITGDLPHHPINHVEVLNDSILTIATDAGVYWTSNGGENWSPVGNLPTMPVYDLAVDTIADRLVAGTFARSIWSFPLDSLLPPAPVNPPSSMADAAERPALRVYPNPVRDILTIDRQADLAELFLTNLSGQVVRRWSGEEVGGGLDLVFLPAGIYTLSIRTKNGALQSQQVVKD